MRLFFALWPDEDLRRKLAGTGRVCGDACRGRTLPSRNLHLTLAFLGEVHSHRVDALRRIGATLSAPSFELVLDRVGHFPRARIVYAGASTVPPALRALVAQIAAALAVGGFRVEAREFVPHVTLVRDARAAPPTATLDPPLVWQVRHIRLVESVRTPDGQMYRPVSRFILTD